MDYEIRYIELFENKFRKIIPLNKQDDVKRRIEKLKHNPYVGKPLGNKYFRELKLDKFRIYYKIRETEIVIILLDVSDKKHQQETIDVIKNNWKNT